MNSRHSRNQTTSNFHYLTDYVNRLQSSNPQFIFTTQSENLFWSSPTSQSNYAHFSDTLTIDTSYRTNRSLLPFITFTGLNHHAQPILFASALLLNETENSFTWLFDTFIKSMLGVHPVSVTTAPDKFVQMAVEGIMPGSRHRFCRWAIFEQTRASLVNFYDLRPGFDSEFKECVNGAESVEEFEFNWGEMLREYGLLENEWLLAMYEIRDQWVPVYMKHVFFGELEKRGCCVSLFDDGVSLSRDTSMQTFVKMYEKGVANWGEMEMKADFDTCGMSPVLKTPSPMEKQAAGLYTRRIFMKFQEELVETLCNPASLVEETDGIKVYRVAKFGEEGKACMVRFDGVETRASCSCQSFYYCGVVCRHILSVFRARNVLMLPSEYVLKRWTRDAKVGVSGSVGECSSEVPGSSEGSLVVRRNKLRQEALKYVEEGAKSIHSYNVAAGALQEATKRVIAVKRIGSAVVQGNSLVNGDDLGVREIDDQSSCLSKAEKEKKIRELTAEVDRTNEKSEVYRAILHALFKDVEDQKLKLSVKVQNARLSLKD